ncbi:MAG: hypothetical protein D6679_11985 [Candidatus Hydrogenedentota bacterium]|nr:MAG: hypothetical protein D6679_11985 [Candidatus Hydrogenedentota bacterium]
MKSSVCLRALLPVPLDDLPPEIYLWEILGIAEEPKSGFALLYLPLSFPREKILRLTPISIEKFEWKADDYRLKESKRIFPAGTLLIQILPGPTNEGGGDESVISIISGMGFGTGTHPTTRHCLALLQRFVKSDTRYWDCGTGSGILAIAGRRLGAEMVCGTEIDSNALSNAFENRMQNKVSFHLIQSSLAPFPQDTRFDIISANIERRVLEELFPLFWHHLAEGGVLILSGLLREDPWPRQWPQPEILLAEEEWVSLALRKPSTIGKI